MGGDCDVGEDQGGPCRDEVRVGVSAGDAHGAADVGRQDHNEDSQELETNQYTGTALNRRGLTSWTHRIRKTHNGTG